MFAIRSRIHAFFRDRSAEKWRNAGRLTTITGLTQVAIQGIGFGCGILVIRLLPTEEYALYILANTMLGTMTVLADGGISAGVMAEGGKVWEDRYRLGAVINTGLYLRRLFAVGSLLIAVPLLLVLLRNHGADWTAALLILLALIPAFFAALSGRILEIVPKLHRDITRLQRIQFMSNLGRLGLLGLTLFALPYAFVAIAAASIAQWFANVRLRKRARGFIDAGHARSREVRDRILDLVKRTMPGAIYYAVAGQLTIWLISIFGNTEGIAQIGALGRLAAVLAVIQAMLSILVVPHFARMQDRPGRILVLFLALQLGFVGFAALLALTVWLFPGPVLSILGPQYSGLSLELLLTMIASCVALQGSVVYQISSSLGIVPAPVKVISYMILVQTGLIFIFDFGVVSEVIAYSIGVNLAALLYQAVYFVRKIRTSK